MKNTLLPDILQLLFGFVLAFAIIYGLTRCTYLSIENRTLTDKVREKVSSAHDCAACHTNYIFTITKYSDNNILINIDIK